MLLLNACIHAGQVLDNFFSCIIFVVFLEGCGCVKIGRGLHLMRARLNSAGKAAVEDGDAKVFKVDFVRRFERDCDGRTGWLRRRQLGR